MTRPPLDRPHYGIGSRAAVKRAFVKAFRFDGRASRGEYWWFVLFTNLVFGVLALPAAALGVSTSPDGGETPGPAAWPLIILLTLFLLAAALPTLSVTVRRLHDAGYSGWLVLLNLIPYLGGLVVLIFCILPASPAGSKYDPAPIPSGYPAVPR